MTSWAVGQLLWPQHCGHSRVDKLLVQLYGGFSYLECVGPAGPGMQVGCPAEVALNRALRGDQGEVSLLREAGQVSPLAHIPIAPL